MKLGLLVGNSRLRYGLFSDADLGESGAVSWSQLARTDYRDLRRLLSRPDVERVVAGSVREDLLRGLQAELSRELVDLRVAGRDFPIPVENHYDVPEEVGIDRLLNSVAARAMWPGSSVVVLDFGTALSVTVVSAEGAFEGGLIGMGVKAASESLSASTPRLPKITPVRRPAVRVEKSTEEGLSAGLYWQLVGGAQRILDGLRQALAAPLHVVATGGDAELLASALDGVDRIDPDLTLRGLALSFEGAGA